jgi:hypothetical protein
MESGSGRFRRTDQLARARRSLRADILALRRELEMLDDVLRAGPTPISARAARDRSLHSLRVAELGWRGSRDPADLPTVVSALEDARTALQESLDALARRAARSR